MQVANKHLEKADRLLQKGKLDAALSEFLLAWKEEPANDGIVYTVAQLYQQLGKTKESRECYLFLYQKAVEKGDWHKVLDLFRRLQLLGPLEPSRVLAAARVLERHKPDLAAEQYRGIIATAGEQNLELVLQCLEGLTRVDPDSADLHHRLAVVAERLGNTTAAIASWRRIASLSVARGNPQQEVEALEQVCRLDPNDQEARMTLARAYLKAGQAAKIPGLWQGTAQPMRPEVLSLLAQAQLAGGSLSSAEELYWEGLEGIPGAAGALLEIARSYAAQSNFDLLSGLLGRLESRLSFSQVRTQMVPLAEGLAGLECQEGAFLERLVRVLERLHLDSPLAATLSRLFEIHFDAGRFQQAAGVLERIITVDPYDRQSTARLERLTDHFDAAQLRELGDRLGFRPGSADRYAAGRDAPGRGSEEAGAEETETSLQDLLLQAEIFLQYGMREKAQEKLARIRSLFPGEEQRNPELTALLERAGLPLSEPLAGAYGEQRSAQPPQSPSLPGEPRVQREDSPGAGQAPQPDLKRISEISRNISRQGTAKAVLFAAVNDIGKHWQLSRCVAGLAAPKRPPSLVLEYISPGVASSDAARLGKLVAGLQQAAPGKLLVADAVQQEPALAALQDTLAALQVESLVCLPLRDGEQEMGVLILEQCGVARRWRPADLTALEGLAEQIVLATANVRLRSLVKALAITDERSGLLSRDSYLTCLLSEADRMQSQKTPLSVVLLGFAHDSASPAPGGETGLGDAAPQHADGPESRDLEAVIQKFSMAAAAHLRQNDIAVRYASDTLALILPGASGQNAAIVAEKMSKLVHAIRGARTNREPPLVSAGVAEAVREEGMDSTDRVTELVNRLEWALDAARQPGASHTHLLEPPALAR